jgi:hypothetical protein
MVFDKLVDLPVSKVIMAACLNYSMGVLSPLRKYIWVSRNSFFILLFDLSADDVLSSKVSDSRVEK